jgi:hypothetical protein
MTKKGICAPAGNRTPVVQHVAWSLYWLSYPDDIWTYSTRISVTDPGNPRPPWTEIQAASTCCRTTPYSKLLNVKCCNYFDHASACVGGGGGSVSNATRDQNLEVSSQNTEFSPWMTGSAPSDWQAQQMPVSFKRRVTRNDPMNRRLKKLELSTIFPQKLFLWEQRRTTNIQTVLHKSLTINSDCTRDCVFQLCICTTLQTKHNFYQMNEHPPPTHTHTH